MSIKKIVIVGGGTAGWILASILINKINPKNNISISLIESKDIPIVGVGESTTGQVADVIQNSKHLGSVLEFIKNTGATYKYGIEHIDWSNLGDSFLSPIGSSFVNNTGYPSSTYDYIRILHIAEKQKYLIPLANQLMKQNKLYVFRNEDKLDEADTLDSALHIDAFKTSTYFREKCLQTNRIERIEDTIVSIVKNDLGFVKELILKSGKTVKGDLFFDASGWSKILMKTMQNSFVSFKDNLLTNKAALFPKKNNETDIIKSCSTATARKYGWTFEVPLQERTGRGYVFNGDMISDEEALSEVKLCYNENIEFKRVISFELGRLQHNWVKNVIAIGLCSNFIEPLEATGLYTTIEQINHFLDNYFTDNLDLSNQYIKKDYNDYIASVIDDIRDFIILHYQSKRTDTIFWKEASSKKRWSSEFERKINIWNSRMPRDIDYHHNGRNHLAGNSLWLQVGHGYNLFDSNIAKQELIYYNLYEKAKNDLQQIKNHTNQWIDKALTTNEYYNIIKKRR